MKNLSHRYILVYLIVIISSCSNFQNRTGSVNNISETIITGKSINLEGIYEPHRMIVVDSLLIITSFNGDYFFHIYSLTSNRLIKEFGLKGKGPNEFIAPRLFNGQRTIIKNDSTYLLVYDEGRGTINEISILKVLANQPNAIKSEKIPEQMTNVSDIIFKNDSIAFYIPSQTQEGRFSIYNYKTRKRRSTSYQPYLGFKVHPNNIEPLYTTATAYVNEIKSRIVAIPVLMAELDFFSLHGDYIGTTIIERVKEIKHAKNEKMIFKAPNMRYYISDIQSAGEMIYVLLTTKLYPDLENNAISEIFVFDWDGIPIKKFKLDREIHSFCYDSSNNRFIGYSIYDLDYPFIAYQVEENFQK